MHDSHGKAEALVRTALEMRLRPRVWVSREPCEVSVFANGAQVAVQDGPARAYVPIDPGTPWGPPWSTSWLAGRFSKGSFTFAGGVKG
jgi:alpha-mannosidase